MKQLVIVGWLSLLVGLNALAATSPIYINDQPINSPPDGVPAIDARAWVNRAPFNVQNFSGFGLPIPFESQNTLLFTNQSSMSGFPGFRFFNNVGPSKLWMDTWTNSGPIITDSSSLFSTSFGSLFGGVFTTFFGFNSQLSVLMVKSTNIASTGSGTLRSGAQGIIHLEGKKINLKRNGLRTGAPAASPFIYGGGYLLTSNYVNDFGVFDVWWGAGTNNHVDNKGAGMLVDNTGFFPTFDLPYPYSPDHQVIENLLGFPFTNLVFLPSLYSTQTFLSFNGGNYTAAVYTITNITTNTISFTNTTPALVITNMTTNMIVQTVFYPTNNVDPDVTTEVRFLNGFGGPTVPVVAFSSVDYDIVDQTSATNGIFLSDALGTVTNVFLARNLSSTSMRRPDTYEISRIAPYGFYSNGIPGIPFFGIGSFTGNSPFDPTLFWRPSYRFRTVTNLYAAYNAYIAAISTASGLPGDPTNFPGRIQIIGEEVDLNLARIRSETTLTIKATRNLTSNRVARVDAPWINLDITSIEPQLIISNLAPSQVHRFSAEVAAWSGTWSNSEAVTDVLNVGGNVVTNATTNTYFFHVLLVDPLVDARVPVTVNEFAAHGNDLIIWDALRIGKSFVADVVGLTVKGAIFMPAGSSWGVTNLPKMINFTNDGTVINYGVANLGLDRGAPYQNVVNHGTNQAGTHFIRTGSFENSGALISSGGLLQIDTQTARMVSPNPLSYNIDTNFLTFFTNSFGALIQGNSDVQISAADMFMSNSVILARGSLTLGVTGRLVDSGQATTNYWRTGAGINMLTRPGISDLKWTYVALDALGVAQESFNTWSADDGGTYVVLNSFGQPVTYGRVDGFANNLALGKLTLRGSSLSVFHFAPPEGQTGKALYVDSLELLDYATNYDNTLGATALDLSPDFNIYFANATANSNIVSEKLNRVPGFHWVPEFLGTLSTTNIFATNSSGAFTNYTMNIGLARSLEIDSDNDGIVNGRDPDPLNMLVSMKISTTKTVPKKALLSWFSRANSTNRIEYRTSPMSTNWLRLTNILNGPTNGTLTVQDLMPTNTTRFYRLRVDPRKL